MIPEWVQRSAWGRTRAESARTAEREAFQRDLRAAREAGECFVVHAPEIWGGWCEVHSAAIYRGNSCEENGDYEPPSLVLKKAAPEWTITGGAS